MAEFVAAFTVSKDLRGEKSVKQVRSKIKQDFTGFGVIDEVKIAKSEEDWECQVFFKRVLSKGKDFYAGFVNAETQEYPILGAKLAVSKAADAKGSGGGKTSGTAMRASKKAQAAAANAGKPRTERRERSNECYSFKDGNCDKGEDCRFSHGPDSKAGTQPRPERRERRNDGPAPVCRDFLKGACEYENCRFSHDENASQSFAPRQQRRPRVCRDFQAGNCTFENCKFLHAEASEDAAPQRRERRNNAPRVCRDFLKGSCEYENCRFSHDANAQVSKPRKSNQVCFAFRDTGVCERGDGCRFSHQAPAPAADAGVAEVIPMVAAM